MRVRRAVASLGLLSLSIGASLIATSVASATQGTYSDPRLCAPSVNNGVCISEVTASYGVSDLTMTITVGRGSDPNTDPNWEDSPYTGIGWDIFINGASSPTYTAIAGDQIGRRLPSGIVIDYKGAFAGAVLNLTSLDYSCEWTNPGISTAYEASSDEYVIVFPASCIGNPSSVSVNVTYVYDTSRGTNSSFPNWESPQAPNVGCCAVTPEAAPLPAATTTTTTTTTAPTTTVPSVTTTSIPLQATTGSGSTSSSSSTSVRSSSLASTGSGGPVRFAAILGAILLALGLATFGSVKLSRRLRTRRS
jgi:hypothetical protein